MVPSRYITGKMNKNKYPQFIMEVLAQAKNGEEQFRKIVPHFEKQNAYCNRQSVWKKFKKCSIWCSLITIKKSAQVFTILHIIYIKSRSLSVRPTTFRGTTGTVFFFFFFFFFFAFSGGRRSGSVFCGGTRPSPAGCPRLIPGFFFFFFSRPSPAGCPGLIPGVFVFFLCSPFFGRLPKVINRVHYAPGTH